MVLLLQLCASLLGAATDCVCVSASDESIIIANNLPSVPAEKTCPQKESLLLDCYVPKTVFIVRGLYMYISILLRLL